MEGSERLLQLKDRATKILITQEPTTSMMVTFQSMLLMKKQHIILAVIKNIKNLPSSQASSSASDEPTNRLTSRERKQIGVNL